MKCLGCKWWNKGFSEHAAFECPDGFGECRRNAPRGPWKYAEMRVGEAPVTAIISAFPAVAEDDWCGEFEPREDEQHD